MVMSAVSWVADCTSMPLTVMPGPKTACELPAANDELAPTMPTCRRSPCRPSVTDSEATKARGRCCACTSAVLTVPVITCDGWNVGEITGFTVR